MNLVVLISEPIKSNKFHVTIMVLSQNYNNTTKAVHEFLGLPLS